MIYKTENQVSLKGFLSRVEQKDAGLPPGPGCRPADAKNKGGRFRSPL